jgi:NADH:ubiquinone oxidoreductase subunit E
MSIQKNKEAILQEISDIGNELDAIDRAYFAGKEAGATEAQSEIKHWKDLAEYRLQLLMKMPKQKKWVNLTDEEIAQAVGSPLDEVYLADFRKVIAKLREKNQ